MLGTRRRMLCTVKPIARRFFGSASPIVANMDGFARLAHAMTNGRPTNISGEEGATRYIA
jgi:hypothetical protein